MGGWWLTVICLLVVQLSCCGARRKNERVFVSGAISTTINSRGINEEPGVFFLSTSSGMQAMVGTYIVVQGRGVKYSLFGEYSRG